MPSSNGNINPFLQNLVQKPASQPSNPFHGSNRNPFFPTETYSGVDVVSSYSQRPVAQTPPPASSDTAPRNSDYPSQDDLKSIKLISLQTKSVSELSKYKMWLHTPRTCKIEKSIDVKI